MSTEPTHTEEADDGNCELCGNVADHSTIPCCSSHGRTLCHRCYKRSHFVEVCNCSHEACAGGLS